MPSPDASRSINIYFYQSPRDIGFLIEKLEEATPEKKLVFVMGNLQNLRFLNSLRLEGVTAVHVPILKNNFVNLIRMRISSQLILKRHLEKVQVMAAYFCSHYIDFNTFFLLQRSKPQSVVYLDHFQVKRAPQAEISIQQAVFLKLIQWLFGINCYYAGAPKVLACHYEQLNPTVVHPQANQLVIQKHALSFSTSKKSALILDSNDAREVGIENFDSTVSTLASLMEKQGWTIFVKGHPRRGNSPIFAKLNLKEIPAYIPTEFVKLDDFGALIGDHSAALVAAKSYPNLLALSILQLLTYRDTSKKSYYLDYLAKLGEGQIKFPASFEEASELLNERLTSQT